MDNMLKLLFEVGSLKRVTRTHCQTLHTSDWVDNIATHSFRVAFIAYYLAVLEGANPMICMCMGVVHDLTETRCGDQNWVHKRYVAVNEEQIVIDQLSDLSGGLLELAQEYHARESLESKVTKDADRLEQAMLLREYQLHGVSEATLWLENFEENNPFDTGYGVVLFRKIKETDPNVWWKDIWQRERIEFSKD